MQTVKSLRIASLSQSAVYGLSAVPDPETPAGDGTGAGAANAGIVKAADAAKVSATIVATRQFVMPDSTVGC